MSTWDGIKSAFRTITGSRAHLSLRLLEDDVCLGEHLEFEVTVRAVEEPLEVRALVVDVSAVEEVRATLGLSKDRAMHDLVDPKSPVELITLPLRSPVSLAVKSFERTAKVCGPTRFEPGATRTFRARVHIPRDAHPSFRGTFASHSWQLRARLDVVGTDPNSGWSSFTVCRPRGGDGVPRG